MESVFFYTRKTIMEQLRSYGNSLPFSKLNSSVRVEYLTKLENIQEGKQVKEKEREVVLKTKNAITHLIFI